ncbi:MAG TPA: hypothetical protein VEU11_06120 [Terriglobales bacterium]|nr:hypothetical protein [Terriglobales bacterium]
MLYFPQLPSGAIGQFPIKKRRVARTVVNQLADGHTVKYADSGAELVEWQLAFLDLADSEINALQQFFTSCEGQLNDFTFLDPMSNLLAWSADLTQPAWQTTLLQITKKIDDPTGGTGAFRLTNSTAADITIQQTIPGPGWFTYCFSVYARGQGGAFSLYRQAGGSPQNGSYNASPTWTQIYLSGSTNTTAESVSVGILLPAGQSVDVFGCQLEPQLAPSAYKSTYSASGVYQNAHFAGDTFPVTTTGPDRHQCTLTIMAH